MISSEEGREFDEILLANLLDLESTTKVHLLGRNSRCTNATNVMKGFIIYTDPVLDHHGAIFS